MTGKIFNIQRYSTHDGPGIRTNVFLSGCSLRCRWCANPESFRTVPELFFSESRCIGCMSCVNRSGHHEVTDCDGRPKIDRSAAVGDAAVRIADACPTGAMTVKQKEIEAADLVEEILRDLPFFEQSGGGITFTGGEPLLQPDFVLEALRLLKDRGIHTAIETAGNVPWENIEKVAEFVDLFLYDIKSMNSKRHKEHTGSGNETILENLKKLRAVHHNIHVRTPLIPGFNADKESLVEIRDFLNELQIRQRTLLPFHQYGSSKYDAIGQTYLLHDLPQMKNEEADLLAEESEFYSNRGEEKNDRY